MDAAEIIPPDIALEVFANHDIRRYLATCRRLLPSLDELSPDCLGVILSMAFNHDARGLQRAGAALVGDAPDQGGDRAAASSPRFLA